MQWHRNNSWFLTATLRWILIYHDYEVKRWLHHFRARAFFTGIPSRSCFMAELCSWTSSEWNHQALKDQRQPRITSAAVQQWHLYNKELIIPQLQAAVSAVAFRCRRTVSLLIIQWSVMQRAREKNSHQGAIYGVKSFRWQRKARDKASPRAAAANTLHQPPLMGGKTNSLSEEVSGVGPLCPHGSRFKGAANHRVFKHWLQSLKRAEWKRQQFCEWSQNETRIKTRKHLEISRLKLKCWD